MKKKQSNDESGSRKGRSRRRFRGPRNNKNRGGKDDSDSYDNCGNNGHWVKYCHSLMTAHVFVSSDGDDKHMEGRYLDTGTTSLMTRCKGPCGLAMDCGWDIVMCTAKKGGKIKLAGVLFIPCLKNNTISLRQLDENACKVLTEKGALHAWDHRHHTCFRPSHQSVTATSTTSSTTVSPCQGRSSRDFLMATVPSTSSAFTR
jgi:hypothetical protein